jgi:organic hydroperoxide reductase OsmC/OhrA
MSARRHHYAVTVEWHGATTGYRDYSRDHQIRAADHADIAGSSDPAFRGDPTRWNPEQLLLASISACHKLWFLHLATEAGLVVSDYVDRAEGTMIEDPATGGGRFERVVLRPEVRLASGDSSRLKAVHQRAHALCFVANSLNFPIEIAT